MSLQNTQLVDPRPEGLARAVACLKVGAAVAFPTETVYGLGADARDSKAVAGIYAAKNRPRFNPLIVHVQDLNAAQRYARFDDAALRIAQAFWPGPLSLVLPLAPDHGLSDLVTAGLETVALRVPAHPVAQALLTHFDGPLAAPSANPSGRISPTTAAHVRDGLDGKVAAIVDGGACPVGVESTILALTPTPTLLRPGGVAAETIETVLGQSLTSPTSDTINSPGQLASHYAPRAPIRLNVTVAAPTELHLGFGQIPGDLSLSPTGDLVEAASNLFAALHTLDARGRAIAVAPIPDKGLGLAINDRLTRAAAPRPT